MSNKYVKSEPIPLKDHPEFNEKWVQDLNANDPSILGLGDLVLRDVERIGIFKTELSKCITPEMSVYKDLHDCIFDQDVPD